MNVKLILLFLRNQFGRFLKLEVVQLLRGEYRLKIKGSYRPRKCNRFFFGRHFRAEFPNGTERQIVGGVQHDVHFRTLRRQLCVTRTDPAERNDGTPKETENHRAKQERSASFQKRFGRSFSCTKFKHHERENQNGKNADLRGENFIPVVRIEEKTGEQGAQNEPGIPAAHKKQQRNGGKQYEWKNPERTTAEKAENFDAPCVLKRSDAFAWAHGPPRIQIAEDETIVRISVLEIGI